MNSYDWSFTMIRKTISMPDAMSRYIDKRVKAGQYGNDSEYIRDLVRKDQGRSQAIANVQKAIDEGLASGVSDRTVDEIFAEAKRRVALRRRKPA